MKLKFKQQQYQTDAVNAVVNCFLGQKKYFKKVKYFYLFSNHLLYSFNIFSATFSGVIFVVSITKS